VPIERVGVIGGGTMGSGIAEICARSGISTTVVEVSAELLGAARQRIDGSMERAVDRGRLDAEVHAAAVATLAYETELEALAECEVVIEAVIENRDLKLDLFGRLDAIVGENAILASNTSSIPIVELGAATSRADRVLGMHFFNPATVQPLVELVRSATTSDEAMDRADSLAANQLGKTTIRCRDRAGFVVNRLLVPYLLQAIELLDTSDATPADIDEGMKLGCAHPMGPLELCDLIGLDTIESVALVLYEEYHERFYAPPPLLKRMVSAGHLGRKTGKGFYDHA